MSDDSGFRTVRVKTTWTITHQVEIPRHVPRIGPSEITDILDYDDLDMSTGSADMVDWEVVDTE